MEKKVMVYIANVANEEVAKVEYNEVFDLMQKNADLHFCNKKIYNRFIKGEEPKFVQEVPYRVKNEETGTLEVIKKEEYVNVYIGYPSIRDMKRPGKRNRKKDFNGKLMTNKKGMFRMQLIPEKYVKVPESVNGEGLRTEAYILHYPAKTLKHTILSPKYLRK